MSLNQHKMSRRNVVIFTFSLYTLIYIDFF